MKKLAVAALALGVLATDVVFAAALPAAIGQTCAAELRQLCPSTAGHAFEHCRNANRGNFSPACKQALAAAGMKLKDLKAENQ
jgi:hypothetical protein